MSKLVIGMFAVSAALGLAWPTEPQAGAPCKRTQFETTLVAEACRAGGQSAAKDAMKKWVKQAKAKKAGLECKSCHSKLAPSYDLAPDGLLLFTELGGS